MFDCSGSGGLYQCLLPMASTVNLSSPIPLPPIGQDSTSICAECAHWAHIDVTRPLECGAQMLVLEKTPQTRHGPFWLSAEILS